MQKQNYQVQLDKILDNISTHKNIKKPTLLLHACCAPCSSYVLEYLCHYFDITIFYYNPNIHPSQEYFRRLQELKNFLPKFIQNLNQKNNANYTITLVEQNYDPQEFFDAVNTQENPQLKTEQEKGERCRRCYEFRLKKAFEYAQKNKFDWFTTTLSISPFKDADKINAIGNILEKVQLTKFLTSDFKKKGGFKRSLELSKEYGLYRQEYCGCVFSKQNMAKFNGDADN